MKKNLIKVFSVCAVLSLLAMSAIAQTTDRTLSSAAGSLYVISAKAGGVNYVQGSVSVKRKDSTSNVLVKGDKIEAGEKVITDKFSKAEILLNPGSYARLGGNTEFEFITTSLDDLKLQINRGTAIFEVYAGRDFRVDVTAPNAKFYIIKSGVYRVDVLANGSSRLQVWKGKAQVGDINAAKVKKSREVTMNGSNVAVNKFDRDDKDELDAWSKSRAKQLAKANARLKRKTLRTSLVNGFQNNRWDFNTFGLWAFDARFGGYCFLPFGYGWSSPYGYGLNRNFFSSRPSNSFYYAVQRQTNRRNAQRRATNPTNNRTGNNGSRQTRRSPRRTSPRSFPTPNRRANPSRSRPVTRQRTLPRSRPVTRGVTRIKTPTIDQ